MNEPTADLAGRERLRELLAATANGDRDAFQMLYDLTSAKLFGVCLRLLPQRSDAEDIVQETYLTVWNKAERYDPGRASPITWLVTIARNKAIDRLRSTGAQPRNEPIELAGPLCDPAALPPETAESAQDERRLSSCLNTLDEKQRAAIRVAFFEGATYDNLASRVGVPLGTMKSWIRRGLHRLKVCLEK